MSTDEKVRAVTERQRRMLNGTAEVVTKRRGSSASLKALIKQSSLGPTVSKGGFVEALVKGCSTRDVAELVQAPASMGVRLDAAKNQPNRGTGLLDTPGVSIRWGKGASSVDCRIAELVSRTGKGSRVVATVQGDVDVEFADIGLIEIGRTSSSAGLPVLAPISRAVLARSAPLRLSLGDATLVVDDEAATVSSASPIDLTDRVFRLGSTGLLMTFDSVSFVASADGTDIDLRGGRLVGVA